MGFPNGLPAVAMLSPEFIFPIPGRQTGAEQTPRKGLLLRRMPAGCDPGDNLGLPRSLWALPLVGPATRCPQTTMRPVRWSSLGKEGSEGCTEQRLSPRARAREGATTGNAHRHLPALSSLAEEGGAADQREHDWCAWRVGRGQSLSQPIAAQDSVFWERQRALRGSGSQAWGRWPAAAGP